MDDAKRGVPISIRLPAILSPKAHPGLIFWGSFLFLNLLLFLPLYLLNRESTAFWPWSAGDSPTGMGAWWQLFSWRNNLDVFRVNAELILLVFLWIFVSRLRQPRLQRIYRVLVFALYLAALAYAVYESIFLSLYQVDPVFYSQYQLALDGIGFVASNLHLPVTLFAGGAIVVIAGLALVVVTVRTVIGGMPAERLGFGTKAVLALLTAWILISMVQFQGALASPKMAVSSFVAKLQRNITASLAAQRQVLAFDPGAPQAVYDLTGHDLLHKPDIYLIFVESYGSVLYKRPHFRDAYQSLLAELEDQLDDHGWHMATALSEAPTWGGGSWMSYTSALLGLRIDTHPQYLSLLDHYDSVPYPHLGRYLQSQGYHYMQVSSIARELQHMNWDQYEAFYGPDRWLRYQDLNYQGPLYGWGPAPPDQYVVWYARETAAAGLRQPLFMFFLTQNSHYPWSPLPQVVDQWWTLSEIKEQPEASLPDPIPLELKRRNYLQAIDYQLRFLTDFVLGSDNEDALYVLIGDHQPQQVSRHSDGFDTPIHVLSRDPALIDAFHAHGFVPGLTMTDLSPIMRHEGFYSLLTHVLLSRYGQGIQAPPPYLPQGLVLEAQAGAIQAGPQQEVDYEE